jgi:amino acid transporter
MVGEEPFHHHHHHDADAARLAELGYRQELDRVMTLFENFSVAFCYLSPVVGVYSLYALSVGSAGPAYLWLIPIVVIGQLFVALVFGELGSSYPIAGALYQWSKRLLGNGYGWWVGWMYGWALIITVASVDTGVPGYFATLVNNVFGTHWNGAAPNDILAISTGFLVVQTAFNIFGVRFLGSISRIGTWFEVLGTLGVAVILFSIATHHSISYLFSSAGTTHLATNPLGVNFIGHWWTGAALIAILGPVYIFYGFESAGDVAEEVVDAQRRVPRAMVSALVVGGIVSMILVAALDLAIPAGPKGLALAATGGVPAILADAISSKLFEDLILLVISFAFFSCGLAVQGAGARLAFSYARDHAVPGYHFIRRISPKRRTPVGAILIAAIIPELLSFLVHFTPSKPIHIGFITYPAHVNALAALVSFGVSGIYISFQMVVLAYLIARARGWRPEGPFTLGRWGVPVAILGLIYGVSMIVNIVAPTGLTSPRGELFNFDWLTLLVVFVIVLIGAIYYAVARPHLQIAEAVASRAVEREALPDQEVAD